MITPQGAQLMLDSMLGTPLYIGFFVMPEEIRGPIKLVDLINGGWNEVTGYEGGQRVRAQMTSVGGGKIETQVEVRFYEFAEADGMFVSTRRGWNDPYGTMISICQFKHQSRLRLRPRDTIYADLSIDITSEEIQTIT